MRLCNGKYNTLVNYVAMFDILLWFLDLHSTEEHQRLLLHCALFILVQVHSISMQSDADLAISETL